MFNRDLKSKKSDPEVVLNVEPKNAFLTMYEREISYKFMFSKN